MRIDQMGKSSNRTYFFFSSMIWECFFVLFLFLQQLRRFSLPLPSKCTDSVATCVGMKPWQALWQSWTNCITDCWYVIEPASGCCSTLLIYCYIWHTCNTHNKNKYLSIFWKDDNILMYFLWFASKEPASDQLPLVLFKNYKFSLKQCLLLSNIPCSMPKKFFIFKICMVILFSPLWSKKLYKLFPQDLSGTPAIVAFCDLVKSDWIIGLLLHSCFLPVRYSSWSYFGKCQIPCLFV